MNLRALAVASILAFPPLSALGATKTWNGSVSGSWHTPGNWTPSGLPANGDDLVFPSAGMNKTTTNDFPLPALQVSSVTISGSGYTLAGNGVFLAGPLTVSNAIGGSTVSLPIEVSGIETFSVSSQLAAVVISGDVKIDAGLLVGGGGGVTLSGTVSGAGITSNATGFLTLSGSNNYIGPTTVNSGTLVIQSDAALGSTGSGTLVGPGATLQLQGDISVAPEPLSLQGTLQNVGGTNSFSGSITLLATAQVSMTGGGLTLYGPISGAHGLNILGPPGTSYRCNLAGTSTFSGPLIFTATVRLLSSGAAGAGPVSCSGPLGVLELDGGGLQVNNPLTFGAQTCALRNVLGNNRWDGTIQLAGSSPPNSVVAVDSGTLTLGNTVSNDNFTKLGPGALVLSGNDVDPVVTLQEGYLSVDGFLKGVILGPGAFLGGIGSIGTIDASAGGFIDPGPLGQASFIGLLTTNGNVSLNAGDTLRITLAALSHDQLAVNAPSTVSLGNAALALFNTTSPAVNTTFRILDNRGAAAVSGTFAGLPQGSYLASGVSEFRISYAGGDGNDVTLTVVPPPSVTINVAGNPQFCPPGSVTLNAVPSGGSTVYPAYQWTRNAVAIGAATASTYDALVSGSYSVTVTDSLNVTSAPGAPVDVGDTLLPTVAAPQAVTVTQSLCQ